MDQRHALGAAGERAARRHLMRRGWRIVATNLRGGAEIDILAERAGVLIACEVKSSEGASGDFPPVSARQARRLRRSLDALARRHPRLARNGTRLDLILVSASWRGWRVRHEPGALNEPPEGSNRRSAG